MSKTLLIVESPTKARTLSRYLGPDFVVKASMGHVKDLPRHKMGVDVDGDFSPEYRVIEGKYKVIRELRKALEGVDKILLAPDPDREGEAIAWHIAEILDESGLELHRVLFNEITKKGVHEGLNNPLPLDKKKFESQQARRILDRLVGYEISPILWKKVKGGLSAGRVQSVALRIIVDREELIRAFKPKEYWHLFCTLYREQDKADKAFQVQLTHIDGKKAVVSTGDEAAAIQSDLESAKFAVSAVKQSERRRKPPAPYITSKLQQEATRRLRMTARKVMQIAQQLYEGVDLGEGAVGLITYMRTDSTRLSAEAVEECRTWITDTHGKQHIPRKPNVYPQKKGAQGGHEAIRPTSLTHPPAEVKPHLSRDQFALYSLIWNRFVASQMKPAVYASTQVRISAHPEKEGKVYELRVTGSHLKYPGWMLVEGEDSTKKKKKKKEPENGQEPAITADGLKVEKLPELAKSDPLSLADQKGVEALQKFTKPPARYSEGSLIKELEDQGIGRPSTYASIISTIQDRRYVKKYQQRFIPAPLGEIVIDRLRSHFPDILDIEFTARMEHNLDAIESGKVQWSKLISDFYGPFHKTVITALKTMKSGVDTKEYEKFSGHGGPSSSIAVDLVCPSCGKPMVLRAGRYGEFLSCSAFPKCRESSPAHTGVMCPRENCGGEVVERRAKRGRKFYGCSKHEETGCDFVTWSKPIKKKCPKCSAPMLILKRSKGATFMTCIAEGCDFSEEIAL